MRPETAHPHPAGEVVVYVRILSGSISLLEIDETISVRFLLNPFIFLQLCLQLHATALRLRRFDFLKHKARKYESTNAT